MSELRKCRADRLLEKMVPEVRKFQNRLRDAIVNRQSGWLRLQIRLDQGVIKQFSNEIGDQPFIEDEPDVECQADADDVDILKEGE